MTLKKGSIKIFEFHKRKKISNFFYFIFFSLLYTKRWKLVLEC